MPFDFDQRLKDLTDRIARDEQLLKSYEDALRLEDDPKRAARYQQEIQRLRESISKYRQEYEDPARPLTSPKPIPKPTQISSSTVVKMTTPRKAVILTAIAPEYKAVRSYLENLRVERYDRNVYEVGELRCTNCQWEIWIRQIGKGNEQAAIARCTAIAVVPRILMGMGDR